MYFLTVHLQSMLWLPSANAHTLTLTLSQSLHFLAYSPFDSVWYKNPGKHSQLINWIKKLKLSACYHFKGIINTKLVLKKWTTFKYRLELNHQISLSKSKCWYSNNCLHFLKRVIPLWLYLPWPLGRENNIGINPVCPLGDLVKALRPSPQW